MPNIWAIMMIFIMKLRPVRRKTERRRGSSRSRKRMSWLFIHFSGRLEKNHEDGRVTLRVVLDTENYRRFHQVKKKKKEFKFIKTSICIQAKFL